MSANKQTVKVIHFFLASSLILLININVENVIFWTGFFDRFYLANLAMFKSILMETYT